MPIMNRAVTIGRSPCSITANLKDTLAYIQMPTLCDHSRTSVVWKEWGCESLEVATGREKKWDSGVDRRVDGWDP